MDVLRAARCSRSGSSPLRNLEEGHTTRAQLVVTCSRACFFKTVAKRAAAVLRHRTPAAGDVFAGRVDALPNINRVRPPYTSACACARHTHEKKNTTRYSRKTSSSRNPLAFRILQSGAPFFSFSVELSLSSFFSLAFVLSLPLNCNNDQAYVG